MTRALLLAERYGWGENVTGGNSGGDYLVTTLADSGPGSLRYGAEASEPLWITFDPALSGILAPLSEIEVGSNKTIDGRGSNPGLVLSAVDRKRLFLCRNVGNVIFAHLRMDGRASDWHLGQEGGNAITLDDVSGFWVHRNFGTHWPDEFIASVNSDTGPTCEFGSITGNHIREVYYAANMTADRVSFHRNYLERVDRRGPQNRMGFLYAANNLVADWKDQRIINAKDSGTVASEWSGWVPGRSTSINTKSNGGLIHYSKHRSFGAALSFLGASDTVDTTLLGLGRSKAKLIKPTDTAGWNAFRTLIESAGPS